MKKPLPAGNFVCENIFHYFPKKKISMKSNFKAEHKFKQDSWERSIALADVASILLVDEIFANKNFAFQKDIFDWVLQALQKCVI